MRKRRFILTILAIALLLQSRAYVWVDALTQEHYWHTERGQYEHVPKNAQQERHAAPLAEGSAFDVRVPLWAEAPCPVPALLRVDPVTLEKFVLPVQRPDLRDGIVIPTEFVPPRYCILHDAPKLPPPSA